MRKTLGFLMAIMLLLVAFLIIPIHGEAAIYDSVIRLHILANSDSEEDQALKLTVRDALLVKISAMLENTKTREEAAEVIGASLEELRENAKETLQKAESDADVSVRLCYEKYPTRYYETLAFPAGEYLSLQVRIGEAAGKNWWCVLFPPLCLSAATSENETEMAFLSAGLTEEQYKIITDSDSPRYKLRFKILEIAEEALDGK